MLKQHIKHYFSTQTKSIKRLTAGLVILLVAGIGIYLLISAHAASPYASVTASSGTLAAGATQQTCASSSGGNCVVFGSTSPLSGLFNSDQLEPLSSFKGGPFATTGESCNLGGQASGWSGATAQWAADRSITFVSNGVTYTGCYSILPGTSGKVIVPFHGSAFSSTTSGDLATDTSSFPIQKAAQNNWSVVLVGAFKGSSIYGIPAGAQESVDYFNAIFQDIYSHNYGTKGKVYPIGFSAGSSLPGMLACQFSSDVSAAVGMTTFMFGSGADTTSFGYIPCRQPPSKLSFMFVEVDDYAPDGSPFQTSYGSDQYTLPGRTVACDASNADNNACQFNNTPHSIASLGSVANVTTVGGTGTPITWYNTLQTAEVWADWMGCTAVSTPVSSTSYLNSSSPAIADTYTNWTGCLDKAGGRSGEISRYVIQGPHGDELSAGRDAQGNGGPAWAFLNSH